MASIHQTNEFYKDEVNIAFDEGKYLPKHL